MFLRSWTIRVGGSDRNYKSQGSYGPWSPLRGMRSPPRGLWVFHLGDIGWILLTPCLSKWHDTGLIRFVLTPVLIRLLTLALVFYFSGGRRGGLLVDRLRLLSTHDRRSKVVLQPHPDDDQRVNHFWGQWER
jgi:hypothetical protein